jgi:hypothetical protein
MLLLILASTVNLGFGIHDHIFLLEMGPSLRREEGSDYYWSLLL